MENLLKPDVGLMFWTVVTFLAMVVILKKIAWGPLLQALDAREEALKKEAESARKNREEMERLKGEYELQLAGIENRARELLALAEEKGIEARDSILKEAGAEAKKLAEKTRAELREEKERLVGELKSQVGDLSLLMAEKLMRHTVDKKVQDRFIRDFLKDLDPPPEKLN